MGSRDLQTNAGFCSSVCCMVAIKEALMAKEKIRGNCGGNYIITWTCELLARDLTDTASRLKLIHGIHFERGRIHSVEQDADCGDLIIRSVNLCR